MAEAVGKHVRHEGATHQVKVFLSLNINIFGFSSCKSYQQCLWDHHCETVITNGRFIITFNLVPSIIMMFLFLGFTNRTCQNLGEYLQNGCMDEWMG